MPSAAYITKTNFCYRNLCLVNLKNKNKKKNNKQNFSNSWKFFNIPRRKSNTLPKKRFSLLNLIKKPFLTITILKVGDTRPFLKLPIGAKKTIISKIIRALKKKKKPDILLSNFVLIKRKSMIRTLKKNLVLPPSIITLIKKKKRYKRNMSKRSIPRRKYKAKYIYYIYAVTNIKSALKISQCFLKQFACVFVSPSRRNNFLTLCSIKENKKYIEKKKIMRAQKQKKQEINSKKKENSTKIIRKKKENSTKIIRKKKKNSTKKKIIRERKKKIMRVQKKKETYRRMEKKKKKQYKYRVKYTSSAGIVKFYKKKKATFEARRETAVRLARRASRYNYRCVDIRFKGRFKKVYTPVLTGLTALGLLIRLLRIQKKRSHGFTRLRKRRRR